MIEAPTQPASATALPRPIQRLPQGAEADEFGVHYRVWAPVCQQLSVEVSDPAGTPLRTVPLGRSDRGFFDGVDAEGSPGDLYKFRLDGAQSFPDPASRFQPQGVHGPSMVVDPDTYEWNDALWQRPPFRDLVIYELHLGTWTPAGSFRSAIEKLPHLRELGVTAIEIMPVADFAGDRGWGYDGVCLYAPARCYGEPDDLRALVDAAHALGLAVILDVVYNHFGPAGNYLGCYIGEYLDENAKTPWGGAIRYGHPEFVPLRELVIANPGYWMREFHIDGFRLDATHAIVDESPRHILKEITARIHAQGGYAIAEDPRNEARLLLAQSEGGYGFDGVWADDFHHTVRVANTHEQEAYLADFHGSLPELADTLRHGWHYRGQVSPAQGTARGTECRHAAPQGFVHCIANHDQTGNQAFGEQLASRISPAAFRASTALLCLSPYTPMLWMGQEWAASTPFLFFTEHDEELGKLITAGRREEFKEFKAFQNPETLARIPDPQSASTFESSKLRWEELQQTANAQMLALTKACLALRAAEPAFRPVSRDRWLLEELALGACAIRFTAEGGDWLVIWDLVGGHRGSLRDERVLQAPQGAAWSLVLSTNEARFGGDGRCAIDLASLQADFAQPELVVLRAQ